MRMTKKAHNVTIDDFVYDQWVAKGNDNLSAFVQKALLDDLNLQRKEILVRQCNKCKEDAETTSKPCVKCGAYDFVSFKKWVYV